VLGHNGAGKTTLVRVLTTLIVPDKGRVVVDGVDALAQPGVVAVPHPHKAEAAHAGSTQ
jgi:ABC-2 type transport system ATP-binding protein